MVDLEALREAVTVPARPVPDMVRDMRGLYALPLDVLDRRTAASNEVLDAPVVWRCSVHRSDADTDGECHYAYVHRPSTLCSMAEVALVRIGEADG